MSFLKNQDWMYKVHKKVENICGHAIWIPEFTPKLHNENIIIQIILKYLFFSNVCCAIVGNYPLYLANKLSDFDQVVIYLARPKKCNKNLRWLINGAKTSFCLNGLHFQLQNSEPDKYQYTVFYNSLTVNIRIFCMPALCGKNYNRDMSLNLLHYLWNKIGERVLHYGIITIPVHEKGRIVYTHQYNSESGWNNLPPMTNEKTVLEYTKLYRKQCKTKNHQTCNMCVKNAPKLKDLASNVVFQFVFGIQHFSLSNDTTFSQVQCVANSIYCSVEQLVLYEPPLIVYVHFVTPSLRSSTLYHMSCIPTNEYWHSTNRWYSG